MPKRSLYGLSIALVLALAAAASADETGEALLNAASTGDLKTVEKLLAEGADPNYANPYGATPLILATNREHLPIVTALLAKGADVHQQDQFYGFAPVQAALFGGNEDIVLAMVRSGAEDLGKYLHIAVNRVSLRVFEALLAASDASEEALANAFIAAQELKKSAAANEDDPEEAKKDAEKAGAILAILEKAGAKPPPPRDFKLPPEALERLAGTYLLPEQGFESQVAVEDGELTARFSGDPITLIPTDATTFQSRGATPLTLRFRIEGEKVAGFQLEQPGGRTFDFVPKPPAGTEEGEDAGTAEAEVAAAEPETIIPPGVAGRDWPAFRGPNAAGTARGKLPVEWNAAEGKNIRFKAAIPGRAHASPIIWGERIFIATAVAAEDEGDFRNGLYGDVDSVEITYDYSWRLYALDKKSGEILWERTAAEGRPRSAHHIKATQNNPTPVTDGRHLVAVMGSEGVYCYDLEGKLLWKKDLGELHVGWFYDPSYQWGHSSSPIIYGDSVILQVDRHGGAFIAAYSLKDGRERWRTKRDNMPSWGTPTVFDVGGETAIVTNGTKEIRAYNPRNGKEIWSLGPNSEVTVGTPIVGHGMVYVTGGYPPVRPIYAIRPGGKGDISVAEGEDSNDYIAWKYDTGGTYMPTPILYGDYLYTLSNSGVLTSYNAKTGERIYRERAAGRGGVAFTASPVAAHGKLYLTSEDGNVYVIRAGSSFERLATNALEEIVMATPAISDDVLYIRSLDHLFAIGRTGERASEETTSSP